MVREGSPPVLFLVEAGSFRGISLVTTPDISDDRQQQGLSFIKIAALLTALWRLGQSTLGCSEKQQEWLFQLRGGPFTAGGRA